MSSRGRHVFVVPVKRLEHAKSRLIMVSDAVRRELALAFALDTLTAAHRCPLVRDIVVVTDEARFPRGRGWSVVADPGAGLNAAVARGIRLSARHHPGYPVAVLMADLPALRSAEMGDALAEAAHHTVAFVADAEGSGTTLPAARQAPDLTPLFGHGSAARHRTLGAVPVGADVPTLRRDVDTVADFRDALALGAGRHTRRAARCYADVLTAPAPVAHLGQRADLWVTGSHVVPRC